MTPSVGDPRKRLVAGGALLVCVVALGAFVWLRGGASNPLGSVAQTSVAPSANLLGAGGGGFSIGVPSGLTREHPPAGDSIAFLAERRGTARSVGTSLLVRRAPAAQAEFHDDVGLYNAEESFAHPGRTVEQQTEVRLRGASAAVEIVSDYPDRAAGGALVRKLDILARTQFGASYHLVLVGAPSSVTDAAIASEVQSFSVDSRAPATSSTPPGTAPKWSPTPSIVSVDIAAANAYDTKFPSNSDIIAAFLSHLGYQDPVEDFNTYTLRRRPTTAIYVGASGNFAEATAVATALGLPASEVMSGRAPSGLNSDMSGGNKVVVVEGDDLHRRIATGALRVRRS